MGGRHSTTPSSSPLPVAKSPSTNEHTTGGQGQQRGGRPQHEFLLDHEAILLRQNWATLSAGDTQSMGIRIFLRIFELAPATKSAFESFRDKTDAELMTNVLFRSHSMRFMRAVEGTIVNLDALDVIIVPNLKQLGRKHTEFHGFHPEYLVAFEQAMDEVWRQELGEQYEAAQSAWKKIFHLITTNVLDGYSETTPKRVVQNHDGSDHTTGGAVNVTASDQMTTVSAQEK